MEWSRNRVEWPRHHHFLGTTSSDGGSTLRASPSACCMTSCWIWILISVGISLADLATANGQSRSPSGWMNSLPIGEMKLAN
jgi:hypothetical protein